LTVEVKVSVSVNAGPEPIDSVALNFGGIKKKDNASLYPFGEKNAV
jgi:hypothetical protein